MNSPEAFHYNPESPSLPQEIERKFLVLTPPSQIDQYSSFDIEQGYLSGPNDSVEDRVRKSGSRFFRTMKSMGGLVRDEREQEIDEDQFNALWPNTEGKRISKKRYIIEQSGGHPIEVDVYGGRLEGLIVAEIEFSSEKEAEEFHAPDWFGKEVTQSQKYKNRNLAHVDRLDDLFIDNLLEEEKKALPLEAGLPLLNQKIESKRKELDRPVVVLLGGRTSSGKTTAVSEKIKERYSSTSILSMDDYFKGNAFLFEQESMGRDLNWDHPDYVDIELVKEHIQELKEGKTILKPEYSFKTGEREGYVPFEPQPIIIVEGLYALHDDLAELGDIRSFVDISLHGSMMRRLLRDVDRTSMDPLQILSYYLEVVEPMYQEHVENTKKNADYVLVNEYNPYIEAARSGKNEMQVKFSGTISEELLRRRGAERIGVVKQKDYYFHPKNRSLKETDEVFRIRVENDEDRILTYKGPRIVSPIRIRPKFEFGIDEFTEKMLLDKYGEQVSEIWKKRLLYVYKDALIALDHVQKNNQDEKMDMGHFVELRTMKEKGEEYLSEVARELGLTEESFEKRSYSEM